MKIDFSKWIIVPQQDTYSLSVENPTEGTKLFVGLNYLMQELDDVKDPMLFLKKLAKRAIIQHYLSAQTQYLVGKQIAVEDNLDYIENEAEKRGLL